MYMKKLDSITITELIEMHPDDHDKMIIDIVRQTTDYVKYAAIVETAISDLKKDNKGYWSELESAICALESCVQEVAFDQGFRTAVRLIISSMSYGGV